MSTLTFVTTVCRTRGLLVEAIVTVRPIIVWS